jgi:hypothetical protein
MLVLVAGITARQIYAKSPDVNIAKTKVCEIVNNPTQFLGKTVEIRAQIWPDYRY